MFETPPQGNGIAIDGYLDTERGDIQVPRHDVAGHEAIAGGVQPAVLVPIIAIQILGNDGQIVSVGVEKHVLVRFVDWAGRNLIEVVLVGTQLLIDFGIGFIKRMPEAGIKDAVERVASLAEGEE
jgi:hypothetical protein